MIHLPSLAIGVAIAYAIPGSLLATILLQDWIRERRIQRTDGIDNVQTSTRVHWPLSTPSDGTDIIDLDERRRAADNVQTSTRVRWPSRDNPGTN